MSYLTISILFFIGFCVYDFSCQKAFKSKDELFISILLSFIFSLIWPLTTLMLINHYIVESNKTKKI